MTKRIKKIIDWLDEIADVNGVSSFSEAARDVEKLNQRVAELEKSKDHSDFVFPLSCFGISEIKNYAEAGEYVPVKIGTVHFCSFVKVVRVDSEFITLSFEIKKSEQHD